MTSAPTPPPAEHSSSVLRRRRDELAEQVAEQQWDLGGLTYEMAIRDHFRLDLLVRKAALLQEGDAELAEVERLLRLEDSASAGACPACAAPHSRGALFCWQCGVALMEHTPSAAAPAGRDTAATAGRDTAATAGRDTAAATGQETAAADTLVMNPVTASEA